MALAFRRPTALRARYGVSTLACVAGMGILDLKRASLRRLRKRMANEIE
jgi:hypothetical protein